MLSIVERNPDAAATSTRKQPVAFGSNVERLMFPMHSAPTRLGIEQGLRGDPSRGPGCHQPDPLTLFLKPLDHRPRSTRGWYFGASTGPSQQPFLDNKFPGAANYQRVVLSQAAPAYKPFGAASPRFHPNQYFKPTPSPAAYDHDVERSRHIRFHESFGGKRSLRDSVRIKCTRGIPDQCNRCHAYPKGDYYEANKSILCSACHSQLKNSPRPPSSRGRKSYTKVRGCGSIHRHDFPGAAPKIILQSEAKLKQLEMKEAYMKLYFSD